ncbi:YdeI/OmpD-associated family protein [Nonomuraea sp. NPDC046570]|uniref:YdeI/OmpD-associated family protein n=1 Tax=Nonomuraea sp. NPDC046570 TaxID=3155255 RepID=UPI0033E1DDED
MKAGVDVADGIVFEDAAEWEGWLADHWETHTSAWLKIAKKGAGRVSVTSSDALDVALCYGWIDGQRKSCDAAYFLQRYSRRRPKSSWSKVNVGKVEALVAAGRMRGPGLAEVEAAQADGRWDAAYDSQKNATVPADLAEALERSEPARVFFESLSRTARYAELLNLMKARTPEGRAVRLKKMVAKMEAGEGTASQAG